MKRLALMLALPSLLLTAPNLPVLADEPLDTELKRFSYMVGLDVAASIQKIGAEIDLDVFMQALDDTLAGREPKLSEADIQQIKQAFIEKRQQAGQTQAQENLAQGQTFLEQNKSQKGVKITDSGLQYLVVNEGDGPKPTASDTVTVNYRGTLIDGTEFDSSYERGQPATFPLKGVIPGWTEGLQLMPVGSTFKFFIPPQLAYGERSAGPKISPNSTLIFEVELLEIK